MEQIFNIIVNILMYLSIPLAIRFLILRRPIERKWVVVLILIPIFIVFAIFVNALKNQYYQEIGVNYKSHIIGSPILYASLIASYFILCFSSTTKKTKDTAIKADAANNAIRDKYYRIAYDEVTIEKPEPTLWAKAFANAEGNQDKAKALYIKYRVEQLAALELKQSLQVTSIKSSVPAQSEAGNSVYRENKGLIAFVVFIGLAGVILLISQMQNFSTNLSGKTSQLSIPTNSQLSVVASTKNSAQQDINSKISVEFNRFETSLPNKTGYAISLIAKIRNNSEYYIKSIIANCSGYDKKNNRTFYEEQIVFVSEDSVEIAPGNEAYFWNSPQYPKYPPSTFTIACQVTKIQVTEIGIPQTQTIQQQPVTKQELDNKAQLLGTRYHDNKDGTITDTQTNLQWMRCSLGQIWTGNACEGKIKRYKWHEAYNIAVEFNAQFGYNSYAGYHDWEIPSIDQLRTLIYCSNGNPKFWNDSGKDCQGNYRKPTIFEQAFPNTPSTFFWSTTSLEQNHSNPWNNDHLFNAWGIHLDYGGTNTANKHQTGAVRFVRIKQ